MEENKSSIGSIIGAIIIIALIILGGLYFWGKRIEESKNTKNLVTETTETATTTEDQAILNEAAAIKSMNSSDDLSAIEADLKATNTINLSSELDVPIQ